MNETFNERYILCLDEGSSNPSGNVTLEDRMEKVKAVSHDRVATG